MKSTPFVSLWLLSLSLVAVGQAPSPQLPCKFSGELRRTPDGKVAWFTSEEMKSRATHKADVSDFMRRADIKATALVEVLVGTAGDVVCLKSLAGNPWIRAEVESAVKRWKFKVVEVESKPVAYLGRLEFRLCNISCGDQGFSMTILK